MTNNHQQFREEKIINNISKKNITVKLQNPKVNYKIKLVPTMNNIQFICQFLFDLILSFKNSFKMQKKQD